MANREENTSRPYHRYVYQPDGSGFRGDFETMYQREDTESFDSWFQDDVTHLVRRLTLAILERYNFASVLDIGCGKGSFTHLLKKHNNVVRGIDISASAVSRAAARYPNIDFATANLNSLTHLDDGPYDLVSAMAVLYYVERWRDVLRIVAANTSWFFASLYVPAGTQGFIATIDEFLGEVNGLFTPETVVVVDRDTLLYLGHHEE